MSFMQDDNISPASSLLSDRRVYNPPHCSSFTTVSFLTLLLHMVPGSREKLQILGRCGWSGLNKRNRVDTDRNSNSSRR